MRFLLFDNDLVKRKVFHVWKQLTGWSSDDMFSVFFDCLKKCMDSSFRKMEFCASQHFVILLQYFSVEEGNYLTGKYFSDDQNSSSIVMA